MQEDISDAPIPLYGIVRGAYLGEFWKNAIKEHGFQTDLSVEELVAKTQQEYLKIFNENPLEPTDGFWELADELKNSRNWSLALVSNSDRSVVDPIIKSLNISDGVFDIVVTGDEVKHRKPSPDVYIKALKELKIKSKEAIVFEDSVTGSQASGKAGLDTIIILRGSAEEPEYPDNVILFLSDFSPIPKNLDTTFMEASKKRLEFMQSELS